MHPAFDGLMAPMPAVELDKTQVGGGWSVGRDDAWCLEHHKVLSFSGQLSYHGGRFQVPTRSFYFPLFHSYFIESNGFVVLCNANRSSTQSLKRL